MENSLNIQLKLVRDRIEQMQLVERQSRIPQMRSAPIMP